MTERITFAIPFEGFYQTDLDEDLDNHILRLCDMTWDDPLAEKLLSKVDWKATHAQVAEQYANKWLEYRNLRTGRFEEYIPPRTVHPRHFLKVSVELGELALSYAAVQAKYGRPSALEASPRLGLEFAWEDAWAYLEQDVDAEQTVSSLIREELKRAGHMDPIFKE